MSIALHKTFSLLLLILIGILLKRKILKEDHKNGLKIMILDLALPAMIFVALLSIEVNHDLLILPLLALAFNGLMILATRYLLPLFGVENNTPTMRTLLLLLPSLAPGLSCFPFIVEFLGDEYLAWAALADIGNKVFVLIIAYLLATAWYYKINQLPVNSSWAKIKGLLMAMVKEPINLVIVTALVLLSFGVNLETLPTFLRESILMVKNMMTPLVLLYIGIAVVFNWSQIKMIWSVLVFRAGITFLFSGLLIALIPMPSEAAIILAIVFPLSACSFWPFAHMSAIRAMESLGKDEVKNESTFDLTLGINILAISLPFSTLLILGVLSSASYFVKPYSALLMGGLFLLIFILPKLYQMILSKEFTFFDVSEPKVKDSTAND
ncbi:permease [Cecembia sp.]|uniref:AEC family transporter n=1 Tax=Cecembia sp. TaxID=1898110 RepID=UPI0025C4B85B|nr:permease [Cecembia sp.]